MDEVIDASTNPRGQLIPPPLGRAGRSGDKGGYKLCVAMGLGETGLQKKLYNLIAVSLWS